MQLAHFQSLEDTPSGRELHIDNKYNKLKLKVILGFTNMN